MIKVYQTKRAKILVTRRPHDIIDRTFIGSGNCLAACMASIFELDLDEVPDFSNIKTWWLEFNKWHLKRGCYIKRVTTDPEKIIAREKRLLEYYYGIKRTGAGIHHAVVMRSGSVVHDPDKLSTFKYEGDVESWIIGRI